MDIRPVQRGGAPRAVTLHRMRVHEAPPRKALDPAVREVVDAPEPRIVVRGGPGTGKTHALVLRAHRLVGADPHAHALLLAGTNNAVSDLRRRAADAADGGDAEPRIRACTLDVLCLELLREHGHRIGVSPQLAVLYKDREDAWTDDLSVEAYARAERADGCVDFAGLRVLAAHLLREHRDVARALGRRFPHVLVDDVQDLKASQLALLDLLAPHVRTLDCFADEDQAIFAWAGAGLEAVRAFLAERGSRSMELATARRCSERIAAAAAMLISHNPPPRSPYDPAGAAEGGSLKVRAFADLDREADVVARRIGRLLRTGACRPRDIAVIVRVGWRADVLVTALRERGFPLVDTRAHSGPERAVLSACLAITREQLHDVQRAQLCKLLNVSVPEGKPLDPRRLLCEERTRPIAVDLLALRARSDRLSPSDLALEMVDVLATRRKEYVDKREPLVRLIERWTREGTGDTVADLLSWLALTNDDADPSADGVRVTSIHRAKGQEWHAVFLLGMETEVLPHVRQLDGEGLCEERRMAYFAVSRARSMLTITRVKERNAYLETVWSRSPFLTEMGIPARRRRPAPSSPPPAPSPP